MRAHIKVEISDFFQKIENTDNTVPTFLHGDTPLTPTSNCRLLVAQMGALHAAGFLWSSFLPEIKVYVRIHFFLLGLLFR